MYQLRTEDLFHEQLMAAHLRDAVVDVIMVLTLVLAKQIAVPAVLDHDVDHFAVRNVVSSKSSLML